MHGVVDSGKNDWSNRLAKKEQEYEQRLKDVETTAIAALAEERNRGDEFEVRLNQAQATHDAKVEEFKAEANVKHDQKIVEERPRITKEFEASYAQAVEHARNAIAAEKKHCEEQVAVEQARFIQLKVEFENYKREIDKLNEAAAQNVSLQDQTDDLQEQLNHVAKAQSAVLPKGFVPIANPATSAGVPTFNISTPKAPDASAAKAQPIIEIKSPGVLVQEAKARLDELLKGSAPVEPAVGNGKPHLPTLSGFMTPTEPVKTPPDDSPKSIGKQQQMMGASDLIELLKASTILNPKGWEG